MVVNNFNIDRFPVMPNKADPVPVIDADTVLACTFFPKGFELKSRALQVMERRRRVQNGELPIGHLGDGVELSGSDTVEYLLALRILEARDHACIVYRLTINRKTASNRLNWRLVSGLGLILAITLQRRSLLLQAAGIRCEEAQQ